MSRQALELVLAHVPAARDPLTGVHPWYGLVELAGAASADLDTPLSDALSEGFERGLLADAVVAGSPAQRTGLWTLREGISEAQNPEGPSLKHDVTVPIGSLPGFVETSGRALESLVPGVRLVTYGHVGDGNLHHNLSKPPGLPDADFLALAPALARTIYDEVAALGGSISAEHGIGVARLDAMARYADPVELDLMRSVKRALDPRGLMNPGKVVTPT